LDDFRSQVSVEDMIGVNRGIQSGEVSRAIASGPMQSPERKFTPKNLVGGAIHNDGAE